MTLIAPDGSEWTVSNLQAFVTEHYELFDDDEDVKRRYCPEHEDGRRPHEYWTRADRGLRNMIAGNAEEWKGWRLKA